MSEQLSFLSCRWPRAKSPRRADVLQLIDRIMPWDELEAMVRPHYQADVRKTGRKGYSLRMMVRCYVVAGVWQLSDEALENLILDSLAVARFIGTDPWQPRPPSASAYRNFRRMVTQRLQGGRFWLEIVCAFAGAGIDFRQGQIVEPVFRRLPRRQAVWGGGGEVALPDR